MIILKWLFLFALVAANGFFVAAEFALVKIRMGEVRLLVIEGRRGATTARSILGHLDSYLSACQLGITFASLGLGWIGEPIVARQLGPLLHWMGLSDHVIHIISFAVAFSMITFLHITLGEQVPKIYAINRPQPTTLACAMPLVIFYKIFRPFIWMLNGSSNWMLKRAGIDVSSDHGGVQSEAELRMLVRETAEGGYVSNAESHLIENVLDLEDKVAGAHMTPRRDVVHLEVSDPLEDSLKTVAECGHTRLPLCDGGLDQVLGIVHLKDLYRSVQDSAREVSLRDVAREAMLVPATMPLDGLLRKFQKTRSHMAILIDEFGSAVGVITIDNVVEEVVGPIQDEFDEELPMIVTRSLNLHEVTGTCPLDQVAGRLRVKIPEGATAKTIGGLVVDLLGHFPEVGETVELENVTIRVTEAKPTHVQRVSVSRREEPAEPAPDPSTEPDSNHAS